MNKKGLKLLIATLAIVIGTKQVHASSVSISPSQSSITKGNIVKIGKMKDIKKDTSLEQVFLELGEK